jgi:hypothetical protein
MTQLKSLTLFAFILISTLSVKAQDYFVGFFGEETSSTNIGHAFIGIGKGTPLSCNMDGSETIMFGFYPKVRIEGGKSFWFGPVDATVKNDIKTKISSYVFKKISFVDYVKISAKIEEWKKKKYELTRNDCISFFIDCAKTFPDVIIPDRTKFITPNEYVKQFILINKLLK